MIKNIEILQEEVLNEISGGELKDDIERKMENCVTIFKAWGNTFEEFKQIATRNFNNDPSNFSTTGSAEDLEELLKRYETIWFRPEK